MQGYVLKTTSNAQRALDIQQAQLEEKSIALLKKSGLKTGDIAWDIGCGNGSMTVILAEIVGDSGKVFALDSSDQQLKATQKRLESAGFQNVEYVLANLDEWEPPQKASADLVFCRFIFMHLKSPEHAFKQIKHLLKSGGSLAMQEPTWSRFKTSITLPLLETYMAKLKKCMDFYRVDYEFGDKIQSLAKLQGFTVTDYSEEDWLYSGENFAEILSIRIEELKDKLIESSAATQEDINKWRAIPAEIQNFGDDFTCHNGSVHHVLLQKPQD